MIVYAHQHTAYLHTSHVYLHAETRTNLLARTCTHTHMDLHLHAHAPKHFHVHSHKHTHTSTRAPKHILVHSHKRKRKTTRTNTYVYKHIRKMSFDSESSMETAVAEARHVLATAIGPASIKATLHAGSRKERLALAAAAEAAGPARCASQWRLATRPW